MGFFPIFVGLFAWEGGLPALAHVDLPHMSGGHRCGPAGLSPSLFCLWAFL